LHAQIQFYGISKFTEQAKSSEHFLKKYRAGQICSEWAETARIRPRSAGNAREGDFKQPASGAWLSAAPGD
jgi:hypothetical protein